MKNIKDIIIERLHISKNTHNAYQPKTKDDTMITLEPWADFLTINVEDDIIEYHKLKDIKSDENYFGDATKNVLSLKPLQSFEDSVNVYVRLK